MFAYDEQLDELKRSSPRSEFRSRLVFTDVRRGAAVSPPSDGIWIKYVARGSVAHSVAGRTLVVRAGEFLYLPEGVSSEMEIRSGAESFTTGVCVFLASSGPAVTNTAEAPIVFSASCSALGGVLADGTSDVIRFGYARRHHAGALLRNVQENLDGFLTEAAAQLEALDHVRSATRYEVVRRLHRARGYLHEVVDRRVDLRELALVSGTSRFELLRQFKLCFGDTPGAYHRKLRLNLARKTAARIGAPHDVVAQQYGFADASSFSHAYRRAFGFPPFRPGRADRLIREQA